MTAGFKSTTLAVLCLSLLTAIGCSVEKDQRCAEIEDILVSRGQQLPTACEVDTDCLIVEVRPGVAAVSNQPFDAGTVGYLVEEYETTCGSFNTTYRAASSLCESDGINRFCSLQVESIYLNPDAGVGVEDVDCECESSTDCPESAPLCQGCLCLDVCGAACFRGHQCGNMDELGFGQNLSDCANRCNQLLVEDPGPANALMDCLSTSSCVGMAACR